MVGFSKLRDLLPEAYESSTSEAERTEHFELYRALESSDGTREVLLSWAPAPEPSEHLVLLHAVFRDYFGSLATISAILNEAGVRVTRVAAFVTSTGVAIDTLELSAFDTPLADMMRARLLAGIGSAGHVLGGPASAPATAQYSVIGQTSSPEPSCSALSSSSSSTNKDGGSTSPRFSALTSLARGASSSAVKEPSTAIQLPAAPLLDPRPDNAALVALTKLLPINYCASTTPDERLVHLELYRRLCEGLDSGVRVLISWGVARAGSSHVVLHVVQHDCLGSLATITSTLNDRGINILRVAAFSTTTGIAIVTLELATFDRPSAKLLRARLHDKLSEVAAEAGESTPSDQLAADLAAASVTKFVASWASAKQRHSFLPAAHKPPSVLLIGPNFVRLGERVTLKSSELNYAHRGALAMPRSAGSGHSHALPTCSAAL